MCCVCGVCVCVLVVCVCMCRQTLLLDETCGQKADSLLCMDQYKRLFSSYRRAGLEQDTLITSDAGHVIVACKNQVCAFVSCLVK